MSEERKESTCAVCGEVIWFRFNLWHHTTVRPANVEDHHAVPVEMVAAESKE